MSNVSTLRSGESPRRKKVIIRDYQQLRDHVDRRGGAHTVTMGKLRDLESAGKLGVHVVAQIVKSLRRVGLELLLPAGITDIPRDQNAEVIVYSTTSKAGDLIGAIHEADASTVRTLNELASDDSVEKLDAIREILEQ